MSVDKVDPIAAAAKDAAERAAKNVSVAPEALYAPILFALQDAFPAIKAEREALVAENERLRKAIAWATPILADIRSNYAPTLLDEWRRHHPVVPALKEQSHDG